VTAPLPRRLLAEFLGSAFLAALVIGSGIAAAQLSQDTGLRLLENAAATAAGLFAIILMFGPVSGGHFNPVVSFVDAAFGGLSRRDALAYLPAQVGGCVTGAVVANAMFALSAISISTHHRASPAHLFAEVIATLGLILVIFALVRSGHQKTNVRPHNQQRVAHRARRRVRLGEQRLRRRADAAGDPIQRLQTRPADPVLDLTEERRRDASGPSRCT